MPNALARIRTATPFGTTPSRWRVYQFHHQGISCYLPYCDVRCATGLTGLEPATSGVTDRHSNQLSYSPNFPALDPFPARRDGSRASCRWHHSRSVAPTGVEPVSPP